MDAMQCKNAGIRNFCKIVIKQGFNTISIKRVTHMLQWKYSIQHMRQLRVWEA